MMFKALKIAHEQELDDIIESSFANENYQQKKKQWNEVSKDALDVYSLLNKISAAEKGKSEDEENPKQLVAKLRALIEEKPYGMTSALNYAIPYEEYNKFLWRGLEMISQQRVKPLMAEEEDPRETQNDFERVVVSCKSFTPDDLKFFESHGAVFKPNKTPELLSFAIANGAPQETVDFLKERGYKMVEEGREGFNKYSNPAKLLKLALHRFTGFHLKTTAGNE